MQVGCRANHVLLFELARRGSMTSRSTMRQQVQISYKTETSVEAMALLKTGFNPFPPRLNVAADLAEVWNWRCRTRRLLESNAIPKNWMTRNSNLESHCAAAAAWLRQPDLSLRSENDFPAFGLPFRELSQEQFLLVSSISQERHRALNWICGFAPGNRWSETPTET